MEINEILFYIGIALAVLNSVITFVRTGSIKETMNMFFRSVNYKEHLSDEEKKAQSQEFDYMKTQYALNERTGELEEKDEKVDIQKLIDSSVETALDRMLNRFMPETVEDSEEVYQTYKNDLMDYADLIDRAEEYREHFGLAPDLSVQGVFDFVSKQADKLKTDIDSVIQKNKEKEILKNEKSQKVE